MGFARSVERGRAIRLHKQAKRAARKVRFPKDFKGTVMWCPLCYSEMHRIPEGQECSPEEQQRIADAHRADCKRYQLKAV